MKFWLAFVVLLTACSATEHPKSDTAQIVEAVLSHPKVANYLHPELSGRVPVTIALQPANPMLGARAFGKPVRLVTDPLDERTVVLRISIRGNMASVALQYKLEGLVGDIELQQRKGSWV